MGESIRELDWALWQLEHRRARRRRAVRRAGMLLALALLVTLLVAVLRGSMGLRVVEGGSMEPALSQGDVLFFAGVGQRPRYEQVVVLQPDSGPLAVKRVAGLPGDEIWVTPDGRLTRNGQPVSEPYASYGIQDNSGWVTFPYVVPEGTVFCLGDHRGVSLDSRTWGGIPQNQIRGPVLFSLRFGGFS